MKAISKRKQVLAKLYAQVWKQSKSYFIFMGIFIIINGFLPVSHIIIPKWMINEILGNKDWPKLIVYILMITGIDFIGKNILSLIENRMLKFEDRFHKTLKLELGSAVMNVDYYNIETRSELENYERAKTGMFWYSGGLTNISKSIYNILSNIITLVSILIIIINARQGYVIFVCFIAALFALFEKLQSKYDLKLFRKIIRFNREFRYYTGIIKDFQFAKEIRLYSAQNLILSKVKNYQNDTDSLFRDKARKKSWIGLWISLIYMGFQISMYVNICMQIVQSRITLGDFSMLSGAYINFLNKSNEIMNQYYGLNKSLDLIQDYFNYFEKYKTDNTLVKEKKKLPFGIMKDYTIEFKEVYFSYPTTNHFVLENINLTLLPNQKITIVGMNGAGKTTFMKLLLGLYQPTKGEILVNGINLQQITDEDRHRIYSAVFQDFKHYAISIYENVIMNHKPNNDKFWHVLNDVGLYDYIHSLSKGKDTALYKQFSENGVELSGGQAQRLAIARALYNNSHVLVLDEPTSALDPQTEYQIYNEIYNLKELHNIIFISHRLSSCCFCDRVIVFSEGKVIQDGHHKELMKETGNLYYDLFHSQAKYYTDEGMYATS